MTTSARQATRADAFARLFEAVHEGVFIGAIAPPGSDAEDTTLAANPHLKLIFGYAADAPEADVAPFAQERFIDADARAASFSSAWPPTAPSPTTCCACAAPTGRRCGSR